MSTFNPDNLVQKTVAESSLTGLKIHVRDGDKIHGASRRSTYAGWIKVYLTGRDNLVIPDDDETRAYLREHDILIDDAQNTNR